MGGDDLIAEMLLKLPWTLTCLYHTLFVRTTFQRTYEWEAREMAPACHQFDIESSQSNPFESAPWDRTSESIGEVVHGIPYAAGKSSLQIDEVAGMDATYDLQFLRRAFH